WNVDIVGEEGVAADAEVLAVAIDGLRALGLGSDAFRARVSDRRVVGAVLAAEGVPAERLSAAYAVIDKAERMPRDKAAAALATGTGLAAADAEGVLELFDALGLDLLRDRYAGREEVAAGVERLQEYVGSLTAMGLGDFVEVDLRIVRGLAYYTGIVFELFDRKRDLRAICGGGRYDKLLERMGGEDLPAVGFGMGDVVLGELLAEEALLPEYARAIDYFVVPVTGEQRGEALRIAHVLRERGSSVAYTLKDQGVTKQLKVAGREGAREVLIVGPDELARGCVVARDMASGKERDLPLTELG
ncbi:MAG: ATP phosphoribosyltransferase regulatory subunit, partial [Gemmatimonadota bacterium]